MNASLIIPILAIGLPLMIPIIAILTSHQRKMAELFRSNVVPPELMHELQALRAEVPVLRERVNEQAIQVDNLMGLAPRRVPSTPGPTEFAHLAAPPSPAPTSAAEERISQGG